MFQIYPEPVWQVCEELEKQLKILEQEEDTTEEVIRTLQSLRGFANEIGKCKAYKAQIREARAQMVQMRTALEEALIRYTGYEMRTVENGETAVACNRRIIAEMPVGKRRDAGAGNSGGQETTDFGY